MRPRQPVPPVLLALASRQGGVVSRRQCLAAGLSQRAIERLLGGGTWARLGQGVYVVHRQPLGFQGRCWGAVLAGGERAVIGFEAAGRLHGLTLDEPGLIDVFVAHPHRPQPDAPWRFLTAERRGRGEPPRTTVEDTALDIAGRMDRDGDIIALLADVVSGGRTTASRLLATLDERARCPHRQLVRGVLGDVADGVHSVLERAYRRDVESAYGLPAGRRQVRLAGRSDVFYEEFGVVVELDGRLGHTGSGAFRDLDRDNHNMLHNLITLRYGHRDVTTRPCEVAHQVAEALAARGWTGLIRPCPRCRRARAG
ncbi:MAG TPA: type IV toxin-antitoxin system AbiEi family antitoxin domain-containing protein [Propionibacteriaceae bacterium]|nr:type IV toxin-antitoxin system AbiEi family antitoxin domain-containing protein [Propionibacteriaceae bacterium]